MHKTYTVGFRRKRQGRTNYNKRLKLIRSGLPRLVVRPSSKNILAQIIEYHPEGDKVVSSAHSKELEKLGWKANRGNIPSAYLVGYLIAKKSKCKKAVLDIGMYKNTKGSRVFAVLKGAVDGGMDISHSEKILPSEDRISGKHIAKYGGKNKDIFTKYKKNKLDPKDMEKHFKIIKKKIEDM
ncbi:MAG: 50S ribosomal protein L18 [Candidatus Woesearchaeota archaeon]|nr:50S ribosomal protein L18 [Candidatus Woesearchaeota archaeon]